MPNQTEIRPDTVYQYETTISIVEIENEMETISMEQCLQAETRKKGISLPVSRFEPIIERMKGGFNFKNPNP